MTNQFKGLGVAMITPFLEKGDVDYKSLDRITEHLVQGKADYLVVMGTTGENPTLSSDEQIAILDRVKTVNASRLPIVFGIGGNDTASVLKKLGSTDFSGVDGILSVSPYYNKPNQEGIFQHYRMISDYSPRPVIMYNVPPRTGSLVTAETTLRIAELPNIVATKEASADPDVVMEILRNKKDDFLVISGDDNLTLPYIALGMDGVISVVGNAYPTEFGKMVHLCLQGKFSEACILHYKLLPVINAIFMDGNPGGVKYLMSRMGLCENHFRLPVYPVNKKTEEAIDKAQF